MRRNITAVHVSGFWRVVVRPEQQIYPYFYRQLWITHTLRIENEERTAIFRNLASLRKGFYGLQLQFC
jgi:hypothetical protein